MCIRDSLPNVFAAGVRDKPCLLYTSDAADDTPCVDLGGRRIIKKKLQFDMTKSLIKADTQTIDKKHSGNFISNLTYDVTHITNLLSHALLTLFKDSLTLIGLLCVMFTQNWKLALISIVMIPLAGCLLYTSPSPRDRTRSRMPSSA